MTRTNRQILGTPLWLICAPIWVGRRIADAAADYRAAYKQARSRQHRHDQCAADMARVRDERNAA